MIIIIIIIFGELYNFYTEDENEGELWDDEPAHNEKKRLNAQYCAWTNLSPEYAQIR